MALSFGTDGVRGVAFEQLTEDFAEALGRAAGEVLGCARWVVGRDTRESGPALTTALAAGAARSGVEVVDLGVVPTPVVAHVAARERCAGAVVSASHNRWSDNGVKLFAQGGHKLSDRAQAAVQTRLEQLLDAPRPDDDPVAAIAHPSPHASYVDAVVASLDGRDLGGLHIVVDCANGAASPVAGEVFAAVGATVTLLNATPDGRNINAGCGSTHPEGLQRAVVTAGADLGLALDGDADRLIAVDSGGGLVDGDRLMALFAVDLRDRGLLAKDTLVVTVMSNLGLRRAMRDAAVTVHETPVGDRYVLEALDSGGLVLGGEQSGHLIFRRLATTGDGLLSGVLLADLVRRSGRSSAELAASAMTTYPQVLVNVEIADTPGDVEALLAAEVRQVEARLGDDGRVLVRASGTEPVVRVMVEATSDAVAAETAHELASLVAARLGGG